MTELLVVVAASIVILSLTLPVAIRFYQSQSVASVAQLLKETLRRAQSDAGAARNDSAFGVKILPGRFVLFQGASYASRTASEDERIDYPTNIFVTGTSDTFVFSKLYATSSASGIIQVIGESSVASISVNGVGKIEIQ